MAESIKFNDKYIDATGVYDSTQKATQQAVNASRVSDISSINSKLTVKEVTGWAQNSSTVNSGGFHAYRIGQLVILDFSIQFKTSAADFAVVATGLPTNANSETWTQVGTQRLSMSGTKLTLYGGLTVGEAWCNGQLIYFTSD